jgi:hypothetical protein
MKKRMLSAFVISGILSLLVLAGCDNPANSPDTTDNFKGKTWQSGPNMMNMWNVWAFGTNGSFHLTHYHTAINSEDRDSHIYRVEDGVIYTTDYTGASVSLSATFSADGKSFTLSGDYLGGSRTYTLVDGNLNDDKLKGKNWIPQTANLPNGMFNWFEFDAGDGTYKQYHYMSSNKYYSGGTKTQYWIVGNLLTTLAEDKTLTANAGDAVLYTLSFSNSDQSVTWTPNGTAISLKQHTWE